MVFYCSSFFRFNKSVCLADCVPSKTKEHGKETQDRTAPTRHHSHTSRAVPGLLSSRTGSKDISYLQRHFQPVPRFHDTVDHYRAGDSRHCRYRKGRREVAAGYGSDCLCRHDSGRRSVLCDRDMAVPFDDRFDGRQYAAYRQGNRTGTLLLHHHTGHGRRDEQSGILVHRRSQHCLRWLAHDGKPFQ